MQIQPLKAVLKMHIHNYIPGQVILTRRVPNKMTVKPTEYDYNLIKKLSENRWVLFRFTRNGMMPCALWGLINFPP